MVKTIRFKPCLSDTSKNNTYEHQRNQSGKTFRIGTTT
jgi:hypothetical protein